MPRTIKRFIIFAVAFVMCFHQFSLVEAGSVPVCEKIIFCDENGDEFAAVTGGSYNAYLTVNTEKATDLITVLVAYDKDSGFITDIAFKRTSLSLGVNSVITDTVMASAGALLRLYIWSGDLRPCCQPAEPSFVGEDARLEYVDVEIDGTVYRADINHDWHTVSVDLPNSNDADLSSVSVIMDVKGGSVSGIGNGTVDLTNPITFKLSGTNGKSTKYTLSAEKSVSSRYYDAHKATIISDSAAQSMWGGAYRGGAPAWTSTESGRSSGAWFIETDDAGAGSVSVASESGNDYLVVSKTEASGIYTLWSGDNKKLGLINKITTTLRFRVDSFVENYGQFAGFISGCTDELVLTGAGQDEGYFNLAYRQRGQNFKYFANNPVLQTGKWYKLKFIFRRTDTYSVNSSGIYSGYGVELYLDDEYIGTTRGMSNLPPQYVGYITMKDFSDSTYSQISIQLHSGAEVVMSLDDISVTYILSDEETVPLSKCGSEQKEFLASYYASSR